MSDYFLSEDGTSRGTFPKPYNPMVLIMGSFLWYLLGDDDSAFAILPSGLGNDLGSDTGN